MDIFELWALGAYYSKSLGCCVIITGVIGLLVFFAGRKNGPQSTLRVVSWSLLLPTLVWVIYFLMTAQDAYAITSLDSEDDRLAESVYKSSFHVNLDKSVKIAADEGQGGNIRFYACCRIADLLATNDDHTEAVVLEKLRDAPEIKTDFFGTNQLTCGFFTPNYAEGPFTVSGIVTRRLQSIKPHLNVQSKTK